MEFTWVMRHTIFITDDEMADMVSVAQKFMHQGYERDKAITAAVEDYFAGEDDDVYYTITEKVINQVENEVRKRLT